MSVLDDLQAKADLNGDGKLSVDDLTDMKDQFGPEQWEKLVALGDQNGDGKVDVSDLKDFKFDNVVDDIKSNLGGMFGGK